jgi:hypothetical protein
VLQALRSRCAGIRTLAAPVAAAPGMRLPDLPDPTTPADPALRSVPVVSDATDIDTTTGKAQLLLLAWDSLSALEATVETRESVIVWRAIIQASDIKRECIAGKPTTMVTMVTTGPCCPDLPELTWHSLQQQHG